MVKTPLSHKNKKNELDAMTAMKMQMDNLSNAVAALEESNRVLVCRIEELSGGTSDKELYFRRLAAGGPAALKEHNRRQMELMGIKDSRKKKGSK